MGGQISKISRVRPIQFCIHQTTNLGIAFAFADLNRHFYFDEAVCITYIIWQYGLSSFQGGGRGQN